MHNLTQATEPPILSMNRATIREMLADLIREEVQPQALTYPAAARYLAASERQVKRWVAEGCIPVVRLPGRLVRLRIVDLDAFLLRHRVGRGGRP